LGELVTIITQRTNQSINSLRSQLIKCYRTSGATPLRHQHPRNMQMTSVVNELKSGHQKLKNWQHPGITSRLISDKAFSDKSCLCVINIPSSNTTSW